MEQLSCCCEVKNPLSILEEHSKCLVKHLSQCKLVCRIFTHGVSLLLYQDVSVGRVIHNIIWNTFASVINTCCWQDYLMLFKCNKSQIHSLLQKFKYSMLEFILLEYTSTNKTFRESRVVSASRWSFTPRNLKSSTQAKVSLFWGFTKVECISVLYS